MRNWKKYAGWGALVVGLLLAAQLGWAWRQQVARQRIQASHDSMMLPSRSRQLMLLADTLNRPEREALFRCYDIAGLWLLGPENPVQNGFVGPHRQRLEVVFQRVRQDQQQPSLFQVRGLMRLKDQITPLRGTIQLRQIRQYAMDKYRPPLRVYTAVGEFAFWSGLEKKEVLSGTAAIDFGTSGEKNCRLYSNEEVIHDSRYFAFEGYYQQENNRQEVLWAADFARLADEVLGDFNVGDRLLEINPKYARYGWNEYFDHNEWWAEKPVARRGDSAAQPEKL